MILFDSDYLKIEFKNVPCRYLMTTWFGLPNSQLYQEGIKTVLKCCHDNDVNKLLADIRFQEQLGVKDQKFVEEAMHAHTTRHGRLYQAVILTGQVFLKFSSDQFDKNIGKKNFVQQFFGTADEAVNWLQNV